MKPETGESRAEMPMSNAPCFAPKVKMVIGMNLTA
jgi:hypothetical protein